MNEIVTVPASWMTIIESVKHPELRSLHVENLGEISIASNIITDTIKNDNEDVIAYTLDFSKDSRANEFAVRLDQSGVITYLSREDVLENINESARIEGLD